MSDTIHTTSPDALSRIECKLDHVVSEQALLRLSISGDKTLGHRGIAQRQEDAEAGLAAVNRRMDGVDKKLWTAGGIVVGLSAAVKFIFGK